MIEGNADDSILWDHQRSEIIWNCSDASQRLYFVNTEIVNISVGIYKNVSEHIIRGMYAKNIKRIALLVVIAAAVMLLLWKDKLKASFSCCLTIAFALFFFICAVRNRTDVFEYDSDWYWYLAGRIVQQGDITLYTFPDTYRGYFFSLFLGLSKHIGYLLFGDDIMGFLLCESVSISLLVSLIIPSLLDIKNQLRHVIMTFFCAIMIVYFWPSFLVYPLTDMFAFTLYAGGLSLALDIYRKCIVLFCKGKYFGLYIRIFAAAALLYSAYNCRTIYRIPSAITVFITVIGIITKYKKWNNKVYGRTFLKSIFCLLAGCTGFLLVSLSQSMVNYRFHERMTPAVLTEYTFGNDLSVLQLYAGITCNRYEIISQTAAGETGSSELYFPNLDGRKIMEQEASGAYSFFNYVKMFFNHPYSYINIYMSHLVNGMTPLYRETYIKDIHTETTVSLTINLLLIILAILETGLSKISGWKYENIFQAAAVFPSLLIIPGQMETRFMLPMAVMLYAYIIYGFRIRKIKSLFGLEGIKTLIICVLIAALWISVIQTTLTSI